MKHQTLCRDDLSSAGHPLFQRRNQDSAPAFHPRRLADAIEIPILSFITKKMGGLRREYTGARFKAYSLPSPAEAPDAVTVYNDTQSAVLGKYISKSDFGDTHT